jgi:pilus assembly protein CpaE
MKIMAEMTFVVFSDQAEVGEILSKRLEETGRVKVAEVVEDPEALEGAVKQHRAAGVFVEFGRAPHLILDTLEKISGPQLLLLGAGPDDDSALLLRAMKVGLREYLSPACSQEEIAEALDRLLSHTSQTSAKKPGRVVVVMGAKGGVGATFVATQLAASLQAGGGSTAIVDLNYPLGDVAVQLDLNPKHTLADLGGKSADLDSVFLRTVMARHRSGCSVLAAPNRLEEAEVQTRERTDQVLELLRQEFDWVIVDVSRSWNDPTALAIERADQILLVTLLEVTTLNHAKQHVDLLERLGFADGRLGLVVNRFSKSDPVTEKDCEGFVGRPIDARIPNDYSTSTECLSQGRSVVEISPGGALDRSFSTLAQDIGARCGMEIAGQKREGGLTDRIRRLIGR